MSRLDKVAEAFQLLGEALPGDPMLARWEERAVRAASQIERENRAQRMLPFGADRAASLLDCSPRHVYRLAHRARGRRIDAHAQKVAEGTV